MHRPLAIAALVLPLLMGAAAPVVAQPEIHLQTAANGQGADLPPGLVHASCTATTVADGESTTSSGIGPERR